MEDHSLDPQRILSALSFIPADLPRDEWVMVGMALHSAGMPFDAFDNWSANGSTYNKRSTASVWRSFKRGPVSVSSLYRMAMDNGWRGDTDKAIQPPPKRESPPEPKRRTVDVQKLAGTLVPATVNHPYALAKGAEARFMPGLFEAPAGHTMRIMGERIGGFLAVPAYEGDTLKTFQMIAPPERAREMKAKGKPSKLNLPGGFGSSYLMLGHSDPEIIYVVEGIGQAWAVLSCFAAVAHIAAPRVAAIVTFGCGRTETVLREAMMRHLDAIFRIVPDRGQEEKMRQIAANYCDVSVFSLPESKPANYDANDYAQEHGVFALLDCIMP